MCMDHSVWLHHTAIANIDWSLIISCGCNEINDNPYLYKEMLARLHTVYYIRAIYHLVVNTGIAPQLFGTLTNMVVSVYVDFHQIFVSICSGHIRFTVNY